MKGQRNMFIMKGQDKTPEKLVKWKIGNPPEKEFKAIVIKMIIRLRERMGKQNEKSDYPSHSTWAAWLIGSRSWLQSPARVAGSATSQRLVTAPFSVSGTGVSSLPQKLKVFNRKKTLTKQR